jgi:hypothetical protein
MASIKGVTLKNLTRFVGMEGEAYQGNIYLNNKKAGWFSQSGDGGPSTANYDSPKIEKEITAIIDQYFKENPPVVDWANTCEFFFDDLVNLILDEKEFNKAVKKGYAWYSIVDTEFNPNKKPCPVKLPMAYSIPSGLTSDAQIEKFINDRTAEGYDKIKIYKTSDDFIIK